MNFTHAEFLHYNRHFNLSEIGMEGQKLLKKSKVLYIGTGGLGSSALYYLAAAGIGTIGIVDYDCVEPSNLHRQILYTYDDINKPKVEVAKQRLEKLNPFINIISYNAKISSNNVLEIIKEYDIVGDGTDSFSARNLINEACYKLKKPLIYSSISEFEGQCSIFNVPGSPCYRCIFEEPTPSHLMPTCSEGGVLGVLPGIIGTIQALEIIKFILKKGVSLINRLLVFDALLLTFKEYQISSNPFCSLCSNSNITSMQQALEEKSINEVTALELKNLQLNNNDFILIDVRQPFEYEICNLNGINIPFEELKFNLAHIKKDKLLIVHCKSDTRSRQAAILLKQQGFQQVKFLKGGIIEWINQIDPSMTRY